MTDAGAFLDRLARLRENYRRLVEAAEEQNRLLRSGDLDGLLALVERKRALLAEGVPLEGPPAALDPGERRRVEEALEETRAVLERLVRLEDEGRALMAPPGAAIEGDALARRRALGAYRAAV